MALRRFASQAVSSLGLRCGVSLTPLVDSSASLRALALRGYATVQSGLKYAKEHEWVKLDGDTAVVGITDFAQEELGDLVYVELPEVGATVTADDRFGVVESVKAASDVNSPVSGTVVEVNAALGDDASKVNTDPYGDGWMIKVKLSNPAEVDGLMDASQYESFCESGGH